MDLFHSVSSGSDSDSDDSEKNRIESELSNLNKPADDGADSGNSTVAEDEDDFNPFRMSGSEDEGE